MRLFNFSAGPCTLPLEVLEEIRDEIVDYRGAGMSLIEMSHRGPEYGEVHESAVALVRRLLAVPDKHDILLIQGGATMQFGMVPMNLLAHGGRGGYIDTGAWASKALADAAHHGDVYTAWSGADGGYTRVPTPGELRVEEGTRYLHMTSNETIGGVQHKEWPSVGAPLVADMSSDLMSRPIPWDLLDLAYGGVQKNLAPAGMALVIVRKTVLESVPRRLATYLRYDIHADKGSLYNTPPVFPIYVMEKTLRWIERSGGLAAMEAAADERAGLIYRAIDESGGFYTSPVERAGRSNMNVVFRIADNDLEPGFIEEATARGMSGLKGHRSVGGCRASLYNAMPLAGAEALAELMAEFQRRA